MKRKILMALVLSLAGCKKEARATLAEVYFPLNVGNSWTYTNGTEELTFTIIGTEEIDGYTYYKFDDYFSIFLPVPGEDIRVTVGREVLFRHDLIADRVLMYRGLVDDKIRYDFTGNEWYDQPLGWCRIRQVGIVCDVPAGEFSDCINFQFGESYSHPGEYSYGEYLAPGVGTIKYVNPGSDCIGISEGERVTFELQSYTIVPEPTTLLLFGLGALLLRKRN